MAANKTFVYGALAFTGWTLFSFLCHWSAKQYMHLSADSQTSNVSRLGTALMVTLVQMSVCLLSVTINLKASGMESEEKRSVVLMAMATHVAASFSTNYSLALMLAPQTMTIKLMEPIMSALLVWCVVGKPATKTTAVALVIVICGAIGFVGNPAQSLQLGAGSLLALLSNFLFGLRNIVVKHVMDGADVSPYNVTETVIYASLLTLAFCLTSASNALATSVLLALMSGFCHVVYTYISTCVILSYLSVVAHAVANILKRVAVVALLIMVTQREVSAYSVIWLLVCTAGLSLYSWHQLRNRNKSTAAPAQETNAALSVEAVGTKNVAFVRVRLLTSLLYVILMAVVCVTVARDSLAQNSFEQRSDTTFYGKAMASTQKRHTRIQETPFVTANSHTLRKLLANTSMDIHASNPPEISNNFGWASLIASFKDEQQRVFEGLLSGRSKLVLLGFMGESVKRKHEAMVSVGLFHVLESFRLVSLFTCGELSCDCSDKKCTQEQASVYTKELLQRPENHNSTDQIVIIARGRLTEDLWRYLQGDLVNAAAGVRVIVYLPEVYPSASVAALQQAIDKIKHDDVTFLASDMSTISKISNITFPPGMKIASIPDLTFAINPVYKFMPSIFDVVYTMGGVEKEYEGRKLGQRDLLCDGRDLDAKWDPPKGRDFLENAYVTTWIGFMHVLRGRVLVTDRASGHVMAMFFGIPHVILRDDADEMLSVYDRWAKAASQPLPAGQHLVSDGILTAKTPAEATTKALLLLDRHQDIIPDLPDAIKIIKRYPM